jgi:hypothetical protein
MAEIIRFNRARKELQKKQDEQQASANRLAFGRTKAEKSAEKARKAMLERSLDGAKRQFDDNEPR